MLKAQPSRPNDSKELVIMDSGGNLEVGRRIANDQPKVKGEGTPKQLVVLNRERPRSIENTEVRAPKEDSTHGGRDLDSTAMKAVGGYDSFTEITGDLP